MKKFKYYGREVEVPDYAAYIAVDADGDGWWYNANPIKNDQIGEWSLRFADKHGVGLCDRVGYFDNVDNWKGSLRSC